MRLLVPLACLCAVLLAMPVFAAGPARLWEGPGIVVNSFNAQLQQITVVDNGAVVCRSAVADAGRGGNCLPWASMAGANAVRVTEDCTTVCLANSVSFQVCVDNNGDGICKGLQDISDDVPMSQPYSCTVDTIFYSHSTTTTKNRAALHVPAWAQTFWAACGSVGYPGLVVITCAGVHNNRANTQPHTHTASKGTLAPATTTDLTSGNFCGAPTATKAYVVV